MPDLTDIQLQPQSGKAPDSLVVLLHGYGDSAQGLITLGEVWQNALPNTLFAAPNAPQPCEINPMGYQWYSLQDYNPQTVLKGTEAAHPLLDNYLDKLMDHYGITSEKLLLVGFSQGTMMSLYTGPRRKDKIAGILGYSGALFGGGGLKNAQKPPIHLIHGDIDSVVPVAAFHHAMEILGKNGFEISGYTTPNLDHSIDEKGLQSGLEFINKSLN
ncbi:MAG: phospholipase [Pseudomonadota bacterium]